MGETKGVFLMNKRHSLRDNIILLAHCRSLNQMEKVLLVGEMIEQPAYPLFKVLESKFLPKKKQEKVRSELVKQDVEQIKSVCKNENIGLLTIIDSEYPESLRQIDEPPILLFYKGCLSLLKEDKIGVVGSRKATMYGLEALKRILPPLLPFYTIVSGLAKGIDKGAHFQTIHMGGHTIAVLGTGLNRFYPAENRDLQRKIGTNHLLLSEYPMYVGPMKHHFPMRNRIIAGLCGAIIVVEAEYKSGSLITAQLALNEGREVFCVPGNITSPLSIGTNHLIQQGAHCLYDASLLLDICGRALK